MPTEAEATQHAGNQPVQTVDKRKSGIARSVSCIAMVLLTSTAGATTNRTAHIERIFARCVAIRRDVEKIRQLPFKQPVKMTVQSLDSLRTKIKKELARQFGDKGAADYVKALVKLGALERPVDLEETVMTLLESQAAAHYDVDTKTYCLLMTNQPPQMLDAVSAHELCHALQDQRFDLDRFLPRDASDIRGKSDQMMARQCVIEGEATFVMYAWTMMKSSGLTDADKVDWMVGMAINMQKSLDLSDMMSLTAATAGLSGGDAKRELAALEVLTNMPPLFVETMLSPYFDGSAMIKHVKDRGGWHAVTALYTDPPQSTEQVLHPEKMAGRRDSPVEIQLPELEDKLPDSWQLLENDVMGELGMRVFLRMWRDKAVKSDAAAVSAAEGWGGDRYYYYRDSRSKKDLLVWKTVWDSPTEAAEFMVAYRLALDRRFPGMRPAWKSGVDSSRRYQVWEVAPGRFLKLTRKQKEVGILDTTDRDLTRVIWE